MPQARTGRLHARVEELLMRNLPLRHGVERYLAQGTTNAGCLASDVENEMQCKLIRRRAHSEVRPADLDPVRFVVLLPKRVLVPNRVDAALLSPQAEIYGLDAHD